SMTWYHRVLVLVDAAVSMQTMRLLQTLQGDRRGSRRSPTCCWSTRTRRRAGQAAVASSVFFFALTILCILSFPGEFQSIDSPRFLAKLVHRNLSLVGAVLIRDPIDTKTFALLNKSTSHLRDAEHAYSRGINLEGRDL